jgi:hypothetical protein
MLTENYIEKLKIKALKKLSRIIKNTLMRDHPEKEYFVDYLIIFRIKIKIYNI